MFNFFFRFALARILYGSRSVELLGLLYIRKFFNLLFFCSPFFWLIRMYIMYEGRETLVLHAWKTRLMLGKIPEVAIKTEKN